MSPTFCSRRAWVNDRLNALIDEMKHLSNSGKDVPLEYIDELIDHGAWLKESREIEEREPGKNEGKVSPLASALNALEWFFARYSKNGPEELRDDAMQVFTVLNTTPRRF